MPQSYGLDNLNRQSLFLADGTEHSFYALPENYPLERATPGPVFDACADETDGCSTEFVYVLVELPEQQTHEQEPASSHKPSGVKWSAFQVMSNYLNAIFNVRMMQNAIQCLGYWSTINTSSLSTLALSYFTNHMLLVLSASYKEVTEDCLDEQEQQKYEHALTCFSKPHQVQFVQQTTEFSIITSDACTQRTTHSSLENYLCSLFGNNVLKTEYCQMSYVWEFSVSSKKRVQWDPGVKIYTDTWLDILTVWSEIDKPLSFTHIPDLEAWPNQFVGSTASYIWDPGTMLPWYKSIWWLMFIEENELVHFKLEFIHHQGVQENYNAKQLLLSSQDSVNIREIGIIFTTFRPP